MIYRVLLEGAPFGMPKHDAGQFGCFKTVYVLAASKESAIGSAMASATKSLATRAVNLDATTFQWRESEVERLFNPLLLLRNEGFVYFPLEPS